MEVTGIILAGGKSSRMGEDKGLLLLDDKAMVAHVISALEKVTTEIIIVSNNSAYETFGFPVFPDLILEKGPLGGLYSGLINSSTEKNIVASCDTPLLTDTFFEWLLSQSKNEEITIPKISGKLQPLVGLYNKRIADSLKKAIDMNSLKMKDLVLELEGQVVEIPLNNGQLLFDETIFQNINTLEEYAKLKDQL